MSNILMLKKNFEFSRVYKRGKFFAGKYLIIYVFSNKVIGKSRFGITASKKFGNSVKRSRIRRLIKENYRLSVDKVSDGYDIVIVARPREEMPTYEQVGKELRFLLRKMGIFDKQENANENN